ncbi:transglycosylase domain-containing protein [Streptomyces sp. Z26]|uniref:transglycosylase domain-containing protein n=1 Tax=Streptomyces sp. Z26 TaxID=2500177 RepID=UPI000EF17028|nr:transglycosylase domain-containing protein [Streptomyces sp. Z26]RLL67847.1 penicillin-binding protein [Streptomyces sp. Z26]
MSEHRRKQPQGRGRRASQPPPSGRRAAPPRDTSAGSYEQGPDRATGGRAEARRGAPQGGGRRRAAGAAAASGAVAGGRAAARGRGQAQPGKKRFIDYPRSGREGARRWIPSWKQVLGTYVGFAALMMGLAGIAYAMVEVPNAQEAAKSQKNVYYWANGDRMVTAGGGDQNRQNVDLPQVAKSMQDAVISAENESFYDDPGVDPMGIGRAMFKMATGGETQSGSTITQQYVKNNYLDQSQTLSRKAKELLISIKVGVNEEKDDILAGYLNTAYFGRGAYGIQAASQAYYSKDAIDLSPSESAFLAAVLNGANLYDPHGGEGGGALQTPEANTERAKARWSWILDREVKTGRLESGKRDAITKFPMPKRPEKATNLKGQIGYLVNLANNNVTNDPDSGITDRKLKKGGYQIYTTFDKEKTLALEKTVQKVKKKNFDPKKRERDKYVQFGGASVKPGDGAIVAIYGGDDAVTHYTNNADYTGASVGSTFKPFVMAAAMRDGVRDPNGPEQQGMDQRTLVSPRSVYNGDNKVKLLQYNGETWLNKDNEEWHQKNDDSKSYGQINLMQAMEVSANTPFIQLGMDVGLDKVKESALDAGVNEESLSAITPAFSLGTSAPSAIRMASSYATFAQSGEKTEPYSVTEVKEKGAVVYEHEKKTQRAFDANVADNITSMLENVVQGDEGTGSVARALNRPVAGKTGTTDDNKHAWFTGYTKQLSTSIGMWRVDDQAERQEFLTMYGTAGLEQIHGASFPAEVWTDYMLEAMKGQQKLDFPEPGAIGDKVCSHSSCPSPTPSPTPSETEETESPSPTPTRSSPSPSPTKPSPSPTDSCLPGQPDCDDEGTISGPGGEDGGADNGGADNGGANGDPGDPGDPAGTTDGGLFGGPNARRD